MNDSHLPIDASQPNQPALDAAKQALAEMRFSFDSSPGARSPSPAHVNGFLENGQANGHGNTERTAHGSSSAEDMVQSLRDELLKTKQENDTLTTKYSNLVAKLTTMRNSVESKLKGDAVSTLYFSLKMALLYSILSRKSLIDENSSCSNLVPKTRILAPPLKH